MEDPYNGISEVSEPVAISLDRYISVVEAAFLGGIHIAEKEYLTYDEVFALLESHVMLPYEGEFSVSSLLERFRDTPYESLLQTVPKGESLRIDEFRKQLEDKYFQVTGWVEVEKRHVSWDVNGQGWLSEEEYPDWQERACIYRLAAKHLVPELAVSDHEISGVYFTPYITNSNQFELSQYRYDISFNPLYPLPNEQQLHLEVDQRRLFERSEVGEWKERGALTFLEVKEVVPFVNERETLDSRSARTMSVLLDRPALPETYFDRAKTHATTSQGIIAPVQLDLEPPPAEDMTIAIE